jgi:hypothetical protein
MNVKGSVRNRILKNDINSYFQLLLLGKETEMGGTSDFEMKRYYELLSWKPQVKRCCEGIRRKTGRKC